MGSHHVLAAVGVDSDGKKHVLGVREGASENAEVTSALLEDLVERGLDPGRRRLFVIDGSKALRKAIEKVFGQRHPIQRCRNHKLRQRAGSSAEGSASSGEGGVPGGDEAGREAGRAEARAARPMARARPPLGLGQPTRRPQRDVHDQPARPPAAAEEVPGSTNLIDSTHSGVRQKTRRVTNWKNGAMALRWAAASFVETEKSYRRIIGYDQLWMLRAHLDDHEPVAEMRKAG